MYSHEITSYFIIAFHYIDKHVQTKMEACRLHTFLGQFEQQPLRWMGMRMDISPGITDLARNLDYKWSVGGQTKAGRYSSLSYGTLIYVDTTTTTAPLSNWWTSQTWAKDNERGIREGKGLKDKGLIRKGGKGRWEGRTGTGDGEKETKERWRENKKLSNGSCGGKRHMDEVGGGNIKTLKSKSTLKMEVVWSRFM